MRLSHPGPRKAHGFTGTRFILVLFRLRAEARPLGLTAGVRLTELAPQQNSWADCTPRRQETLDASGVSGAADPGVSQARIARHREEASYSPWRSIMPLLCSSFFRQSPPFPAIASFGAGVMLAKGFRAPPSSPTGSAEQNPPPIIRRATRHFARPRVGRPKRVPRAPLPPKHPRHVRPRLPLSGQAPTEVSTPLLIANRSVAKW